MSKIDLRQGDCLELDRILESVYAEAYKCGVGAKHPDRYRSIEAVTSEVKNKIKAKIQEQQKALIDHIVEEVNKDTYLYANNSHVGRARKTIITKLNQIKDKLS